MQTLDQFQAGIKPRTLLLLGDRSTYQAIVQPCVRYWLMCHGESALEETSGTDGVICRSFIKEPANHRELMSAVSKWRDHYSCANSS